MLKELKEEYLLFLEENLITLKKFLPLYVKAGFVFDDPEILVKVLSSVKKYFSSSINELKLYNHILFNQRKYLEDNIYSVLDTMYQLQYDKDIYIEMVFDQLSLSIDMELMDKFYLPKEEPIYVDESMNGDLKLALLGYSRNHIYDFFIKERMFDVDDINYLNELIHEFRLDDMNYDKACVRVTDKANEAEIEEIWVPRTTNDFTMLINVHEVTHAGVIGVSDNLVGYDVLNNDLPRFYEGVYKMKDSLIQTDICHTPLSRKLLDEYKNEPFLEQVEKYKYYVKKL